jgi:hypothetical protein
MNDSGVEKLLTTSQMMKDLVIETSSVLTE